MALWNVRIAVVELVEADTADDAIQLLAQKLNGAGFDPLEEDRDAFESEPIPEDGRP